MSRKSKKAEREALAKAQAKKSSGPRVVYRVINNCFPVPVAPPSDNIQILPIVQTIPIVPYSSQNQPIAMFDDGEYDEE